MELRPLVRPSGRLPTTSCLLPTSTDGPHGPHWAAERNSRQGGNPASLPRHPRRQKGKTGHGAPPHNYSRDRGRTGQPRTEMTRGTVGAFPFAKGSSAGAVPWPLASSFVSAYWTVVCLRAIGRIGKSTRRQKSGVDPVPPRHAAAYSRRVIGSWTSPGDPRPSSARHTLVIW
ncbi:hypothetical protein VTK73DRAFT_4757 [Phialemonium thermophilum]|uniref:Uncharacterized protein n=1 Tax=Phialemonium thermophilum TaxID=223376 RepID=A0ABR3V637_9PEZI